MNRRHILTILRNTCCPEGIPVEKFLAQNGLLIIMCDMPDDNIISETNKVRDVFLAKMEGKFQ